MVDATDCFIYISSFYIKISWFEKLILRFYSNLFFHRLNKNLIYIYLFKNSSKEDIKLSQNETCEGVLCFEIFNISESLVHEQPKSSLQEKYCKMPVKSQSGFRPTNAVTRR